MRSSNALNPSSLRLLSLTEIRAERLKRKSEAERTALERNVEVVRNRCKSLAEFVRLGWHVLEPVARYVHGWHIDAICEHLEAVTAGTIPRLLINVPPGTMKSLIVSVFWPAWEWGPCGMSSMRYLTTSWKSDFVDRDARRMRDLVASEWFQAHWPEVQLVRAGETSFSNTATGNREGMAFKGLTSGRGDRLIIDDPHSTETAESDAEREKAIRIFRESVPTRINDPERSAIVVVMQRLHSNDVSGQILALHLDYVHLMLPMEYEPERRCVTVTGFADPRTYDGQLLCPERFSRVEVDRLKATMGGIAVAGQFQQRPTPRGGGLFKRAWFAGKVIKQAPPGTLWCRHWDLAATKKLTAARTAGVKMGKTQDGRYVVGHAILAQEEGNTVKQLIKATAEQDGPECIISLPQDPGQAGKVQSKDYVGALAGYMAYAQAETGDKYTRAMPFSAQCEAGNVEIIEGLWNEAYLDELCAFPGGPFADQVDASSGAFGRLVGVEPQGPITGHSRRAG
jgi:predicted phage terminase large subunit-like protein